MDKNEYIKFLQKLNLPKNEYIILSGGSLLMRGIRKTTADLDLCISDKLAEQIDLYHMPKDEKGFYCPCKNVQMMNNYNNFKFDIVDGYQCETLKSILDFKRQMSRPKDLVDIAKIEEFLRNNPTA